MNDKEIKAIIVDDEAAVRTVLGRMLESFPWVTVVGEASNVPEAVRQVHQHAPDLIFLDIEMPGYSGLQILEFFNPDDITFDIIFVTAYDEYAIEAFKLSAFDYLLKPIDPLKLKETLDRYQKRGNNHQLFERASHFQAAYQSQEALDRIAVSAMDGITFINLADIVMLEASGAYTNIYKLDEKKIVASKPLGEFESMLSENGDYFRPHRSHLINLKHIDRLETAEGDIIHMKGGVQVPLSRYKKKEFQDRIRDYRV